MEQEQQTQRGTFLTAVTLIANIYLVLFAVDAGVSLFDEVLKTTGASPLAAVRMLVAELAVLYSLAMLLVTIFVPQLPKLIFWPLIFFQFWAAVGAPPFTFTEESTAIALQVVQAVLIASAFLIIKLRTGHWLLNAGLLPRKSHLVLRSIVSVIVVGLILPLVAMSFLLVAFTSMMEKQTGGYLHFSGEGIEVRETVLRKGDKTVRLIGMVHVGDPKFYETLYASFPPSGLVLAEGVTDRDGRLASSFSYKGLAEVLGLKVQPQFAHPGGEGDDKPAAARKPAAPSGPREPISIPATPGHPRVIYADADVADFSPTTVRFLGKVGEIYGSSSFNELLTRLNAIGDEFTEADITGVFEDILTKRNSRVLAEFDKRIGEYETIVIPWGAQHMPGLEAAMLQRGFHIESQRMLPLARYQTIIDRLMELTQKPQSATSFWYRQKMWIG